MTAPTSRDLEELAAAAALFARAHPALAPRLGQPSVDPDVERLVEGFAYLTQQVHSYLDASAGRITASVAEMLVPDLVRPLPSATILELSALAPSAQRQELDAGAEFESTPVDGVRCRFRSFAPVTVVPWQTRDARFVATPDGGSALRVELVATVSDPEASVASPFPLRLHLGGDRHTAMGLRLLILHGLRPREAVVVTVAGREDETRRVLPAQAVCSWGLGEHEGILPTEPGEHPGFRLAREYFALPAKAAFVTVDADGMFDPALRGGARITLLFQIAAGGAPPIALTRESIRTNCLPVANVFATSSDPVRPSLQRPVVPLRPAGLALEHAEVYAVRSATGYVEGSRVSSEFFPFVRAASEQNAEAFYALHRFELAGTAQMSVHLGLPRDAGAGKLVEAASFDLWATHRGLPMRLGLGDVRHASSSSPPGLAFRNIVSLSPHRPVVLGRPLERRALGLLAAAHADRTERDVLATTIGALDPDLLGDGPPRQAARRRLAALEAVASVPDAIAADARGGPRLGRHVTLSLAERAFDGEGDALVFGEMVARLLGHDAPVAGFVRTTIRLTGTGAVYELPARAGDEEVG